MSNNFTCQYWVPMTQKIPDHPCPQAKPTLQQEAIYDELDQIPIPVKCRIFRHALVSHDLLWSMQKRCVQVQRGIQNEGMSFPNKTTTVHYTYSLSIGSHKESSSTLEEFNWGVSELKPRTKLDSWPSPLTGFQETDADEQTAFPNVETESITFWNSAWKEQVCVSDVTRKTRPKNFTSTNN